MSIDYLSNCKNSKYKQKINKIIAEFQKQLSSYEKIKVSLVNKAISTNKHDVQWDRVDIPEGESSVITNEKDGLVYNIVLFDKQNKKTINEKLFIIFLHELSHVIQFMKGNIDNHPTEREIWFDTFELYKSSCTEKEINKNLFMNIMVDCLYSYKEYLLEEY